MDERPPIRERAEELERASLSTWAVLAAETKGRDRFEEPDPLRTAFQQDRDRITRTLQFERLSAKTEAFLPAEPGAPGRGWLNRLTQRLAASQVARTLARALRLNEDLSEAVALAHTLGAPPFGPAGEAVLGELTEGSFAVTEQSLRVVECLADSGHGLNLTWEVRDGVLHRGIGAHASTLEGQVAALADRLAAALHTLDRALAAELVHLDDVPFLVRARLGTDHRARIAVAVRDVVASSTDRPEVTLSGEVSEAIAALERFLDERVHGRADARWEADRAIHCLQSVAIYLRAHPSPTLEGAPDPAQALVDQLCGSTDGEILDAFTATFRPTGYAAS